MNEANIETHGYEAELQGWFDKSQHPAHLPEWKAAHRDRISRLVKPDKNYPSVIIWSLGNECGNGPVFHEACAWLKQRDPSRPVQFEQAGEEVDTSIASRLPPSVWLDNVFWLCFVLFYVWCLRTFFRYVQDVWRSEKFFP